jgi:hypothetical protein
VTAVGVRLAEAPDAPSRGEVYVRNPSGQHRAPARGCASVQCRASVRHRAPIERAPTLRAPLGCARGSWARVRWALPLRRALARRWALAHRQALTRRVALGETHLSGDVETLHAPRPQSLSRRYAPAVISRMPIDQAIAECITTALTDQDGSDSGSRVAVIRARSRLGDPASWKDPL